MNKKRTREELAEATPCFDPTCPCCTAYAALCQKYDDEIARLRANDGERIEGWVDRDAIYWAKGQNPPLDRYFIVRMWKRQGVKDCPATLILHNPKEQGK